MSIKLENELLHEKDEFMYKLYFHAIRRYVDYATGIVGIRRGISWQSLAEEMYVAPRPGCNTRGLPHKSTLRRALRQLEKIGLIKTRSSRTKLIFELPIIMQDISAQKKADTKPTAFLNHEPDSLKTQTDLDLPKVAANQHEKADTEADITISPKADIPHIVILKDKSLEAIVHSRFDEFWQAYPRKENKKKAASIWARMNLDAKAETIITDVKLRIVKHEPWQDKQFIPHATTYLNGERWEDEIRETPYEPTSPGRQKTNSMSVAIDNILNSPSRSTQH